MKPIGLILQPNRYGLRPGFVNAATAMNLLVAVILLWSVAAAAEPVRILALGDSLTAGYGLARSASFPARLAHALGAGGRAVEVINAGVSGDTTAGGLARLEWALAELPDVVILELGANDGLRGLEPASTSANLDAMLTRLAAARVAVLLAGMKAPPNLGSEYSTKFDAIFPRLARKHGVAFYPFFLDGVAARPELNQEDGIHPNALGVAVIVERILPHVKALIARRR